MDHKAASGKKKSVGPCTWEPGRGVPGYRGGPCLLAICLFLLEETSVAMVLSGCFTFSPAQWAPRQLNGPVQLNSLVVDKIVD